MTTATTVRIAREQPTAYGSTRWIINITPSRRWVLEAIRRGELVKDYLIPNPAPTQGGYTLCTNALRRRETPATVESILWLFVDAGLAELPAETTPTDSGSMRRYQLTEAGQRILEG